MLYVCMYVCIYACMYVCMYVRMYVRTYEYLLCQLLEKMKQVQCLEIKQKAETKMVVKNNSQSLALLLMSIKLQIEMTRSMGQ